jgi:hypothetical protein
VLNRGLQMTVAAHSRWSPGGGRSPIHERREQQMTEQPTDETSTQTQEDYAAPQLIELDTVSKVTLGKYAEDSADKGRYFE